MIGLRTSTFATSVIRPVSSHNRNLTAERRTVLLALFPATSDHYSITLAAAPVNTATIVHFALKDGTAISATVCPKRKQKTRRRERKELGKKIDVGGSGGDREEEKLTFCSVTSTLPETKCSSSLCLLFFNE